MVVGKKAIQRESYALGILKIPIRYRKLTIMTMRYQKIENVTKANQAGIEK